MPDTTNVALLALPAAAAAAADWCARWAAGVGHTARRQASQPLLTCVGPHRLQAAGQAAGASTAGEISAGLCGFELLLLVDALLSFARIRDFKPGR
jgi:hypothetical protein